MKSPSRPRAASPLLAAVLASAVFAMPTAVHPQSLGLGDTLFRQAVAEGVYDLEDTAALYRDRDYAPIFAGSTPLHMARRAALIEAVRTAPAHGLPVRRYDAEALIAAFGAATSPRAQGKAEALAARMLVAFAHDLTAGALIPSQVDRGIVREVPRSDPTETLRAFLAAENPRAYLRSLAPKTAEYARLLAEKHRLEALRAQGGWGPLVTAAALQPGATGADVVALRNRLIRKGYLDRSNSAVYDRALEAAVRQFQRDHGLNADGAAGASTLREINASVDQRLISILVALERERWLNAPRGERHVLVNLADFTAKILDGDKVTFETRAVIGEGDPEKRTPEFSDMMEYLEINPDWTVPRGILTRDYLPRLQRNAGALSHLKVVDSRGRVVPRSSINFARYTARTFPYSLRQPPGPRNALGTVKFMFPNKYAIYLHDTPDKSLFGHESRAYSNGCVRLHDPHDFAYAILAPQIDDPKTYFDRILASGQQTRVRLDTPVPVHLIYRTAFTYAKGKVNYRSDVYGRDMKIWNALRAEGVTLGGAES